MMTATGRKIKKNPPAYLEGCVVYKSKRARKSPETWAYANRFFSHMLIATGANVAVVSAVFVIAAVCFADVNGWILAAVFIGIQAVCLIIPVIMTEVFIDKFFDKDGNEKDKDENVKN